jgi:hypothetical protein
LGNLFYSFIISEGIRFYTALSPLIDSLSKNVKAFINERDSEGRSLCEKVINQDTREKEQKSLAEAFDKYATIRSEPSYYNQGYGSVLSPLPGPHPAIPLANPAPMMHQNKLSYPLPLPPSNTSNAIHSRPPLNINTYTTTVAPLNAFPLATTVSPAYPISPNSITTRPITPYTASSNMASTCTTHTQIMPPGTNQTAIHYSTAPNNNMQTGYLPGQPYNNNNHYQYFSRPPVPNNQGTAQYTQGSTVRHDSVLLGTPRPLTPGNPPPLPSKQPPIPQKSPHHSTFTHNAPNQHWRPTNPNSDSLLD